MKRRALGEVVKEYLVITAFAVAVVVTIAFVVMEVQSYRERVRRERNNNDVLHVLPVGNF